MESILCVDIPVQMISCTDTNGKITPMRFRFRDKTGELITVTIDKVLSEEQYKNKVGASFSCTLRNRWLIKRNVYPLTLERAWDKLYL